MRVAILGCGYVGLELGRQLTDSGHEVVGVRRSSSGIEEIRAAGFEAVQADVTDPDSLSAVPDADAVVFAASSGGRGVGNARDVYVEGMTAAIEQFADRADSPDRFVYTSSTGVYGDHDGEWVDESTAVDRSTERTAVLADAESVALERTAEVGMDGTAVRLGGIYGPGRYRLERYLDDLVTEGYLNLIHREDAAGAVAFLLSRDLARGDVVLVVDDEPVSKWEFADWLAEQCGREAPPKQTVAERLAGADLSGSRRERIAAKKRCSNERLRTVGYEFRYPTFREGFRPAIEAYCEAE
jgi:nucleoside-diphosphate-sugar epimerase